MYSTHSHHVTATYNVLYYIASIYFLHKPQNNNSITKKIYFCSACLSYLCRLLHIEPRHAKVYTTECKFLFLVVIVLSNISSTSNFTYLTWTAKCRSIAIWITENISPAQCNKWLLMINLKLWNWDLRMNWCTHVMCQLSTMLLIILTSCVGCNTIH
jgi:hypothetical protein